VGSSTVVCEVVVTLLLFLFPDLRNPKMEPFLLFCFLDAVSSAGRTVVVVLANSTDDEEIFEASLERSLSSETKVSSVAEEKNHQSINQKIRHFCVTSQF
jgi:hypothetical protein